MNGNRRKRAVIVISSHHLLADNSLNIARAMSQHFTFRLFVQYYLFVQIRLIRQLCKIPI